MKTKPLLSAMTCLLCLFISTNADAAGASQAPFTGNLPPTSDFTIGGKTAAQILPSSNGLGVTGYAAGDHALASLTGTTYGMVGIGPATLGLLTNPDAEITAVGVRAGGSVTNAYGGTFIGESAASSDNCGYCTAIGNDAARNTIGMGASTLIGAQTLDDGTPTGANTVVGALSLRGSAGTLTVPTGSYHQGDIYTVTLATTQPCGSAPCTTIPTAVASYTVPASATASTVANGLNTAISALGISYSYVQPIGLNYPATTLGTWLNVDSLGNWYISLHIQGGSSTGASLTMTPACTGTCTSALSSSIGAFTGADNVVVGFSTLKGNALGAANNNNLVGDNIAGAAVGNFSDNDVIGTNALKNATTDQRNVGQGSLILFNSQGSTDNVCEGYKACFGVTTGGYNVVIGSKNQNGTSSITSGGGNIEIGNGASVPSPTANFQMAIHDAIYGGGNGKGSGGGYGWVGTYCTSGNGNASLTLCDAAGGNSNYGNHFGVLQTTAPTVTNGTLDSTASDVAGTITLTAASPTITFRVPFKTAPHCIVSSPTGTAFTYASATTALTLTGGASGNTATYVCVQ